MKVAAIIAARLESSRLPGKALADIEGVPMVVHTCKRTAMATSIDEVYLATDNLKIKVVAEAHDIKVIMTAPSHKNSSERVAEAAQQLDADIIVNVQGDEPLVYPEHIDKIVHPFLNNDEVDLTIGVTKFFKRNSLGDIKAVLGFNNNVLYASRNDIPCYYLKKDQFMWKLCFIVPCKRQHAIDFLSWSPTALELVEDNHFLRFIENGLTMKAIEIEGAKVSVDTAEDLAEIREYMKNDEIKNLYCAQSQV